MCQNVQISNTVTNLDSNSTPPRSSDADILPAEGDITMACRWLVSCLALAMLVTGSLFGQGNTGSILGSVADASGAVVPNARISITNTRTGVQGAATTDALGNYLFNFLAPGSYQLEAEVSGFKKFTRENVNLEM